MLGTRGEIHKIWKREKLWDVDYKSTLFFKLKEFGRSNKDYGRSKTI